MLSRREWMTRLAILPLAVWQPKPPKMSQPSQPGDRFTFADQPYQITRVTDAAIYAEPVHE